MAILQNRSILHLCWLQNHSPWFLTTEPWLLLLQLQLFWSTQLYGTQERKWRPESWELISLKKKFKKKIFLHLGERQVCESMPDSVVLKTGRKLKQSLLCVLWPLIFFFSLHYQIFAAPGFCQLYVIPRQKVLPKDLLEGRGRKKGVFFNLMSMMSSL